MSNPKPSAQGADWTRLLADPDLVTHLGELLQTYRDAPPATRDEALLDLMRKIKQGATKNETGDPVLPVPAELPPPPPVATPAVASPPFATPPFEAQPFAPDIFTPSWG